MRASADDTARCPGLTFSPLSISSLPPAAVTTRSACRAGSTRSTWPLASWPRSSTPARSPAGCCSPRAATAARPSARPARPSTSGTPASSFAPGSWAAKSVPESIAEHPCVFATLTAPSFGPVHARRMRGKTVLPCRPRRDPHARRCPHGRDISCARRHNPDDPRLGRPLCGDCYDYDAAVLFNAHAGRPVAPVHHLPAPPPRPPRRAHPRPAAPPARHPLRQSR